MKIVKTSITKTPKLGELMEVIDRDKEISWGILVEDEESELFLVLLNINTIEFVTHISHNEILTKRDSFTILNIYPDIIITI